MKLMLENKDGSAVCYDVERVVIDARGHIVTSSREGINNEGEISEFAVVVIGHGKDLKNKTKEEKPK